MPPKRKGPSKGKPEQEAGGGITGAEALQLKQALQSGHTLDDDTILTLLKADVPCEGLFSKACKVILHDQTAWRCRAARPPPPPTPPTSAEYHSPILIVCRARAPTPTACAR